MASEHQVRQYLAYWLQLGKKVLIRNGQTALLPTPVIAGDRYSDEFEACWQQVKSTDAGDCYLEGSNQTIQELLSPAWDLSACARCSMPVPMPNVGITDLECPCIDLPTWPNTEMPMPRSPVNSQACLVEIRDRILKTNQNQEGVPDPDQPTQVFVKKS